MFCLKWKTTQITVNPFEVARDFQDPQFQCRFSWPTRWLPAQIYFARNLWENLKTFSLKLSLLRLLLETKDFGQEFQLNCFIYTNKDNPLNEMLDNLFRWQRYENPLGNVIYTPLPPCWVLIIKLRCGCRYAYKRHYTLISRTLPLHNGIFNGLFSKGFRKKYKFNIEHFKNNVGAVEIILTIAGVWHYQSSHVTVGTNRCWVTGGLVNRVYWALFVWGDE